MIGECGDDRSSGRHEHALRTVEPFGRDRKEILVSQEPHPPTDQTPPGATPAQEPGATSELERQRAESDYPGSPEPDALEDRAAAEEQPEDPGGSTANVEVPPTETVPDEVAEQAAQHLDPLTDRPDPGMQHQNPMRPAFSTSDIQKERPPADDL